MAELHIKVEEKFLKELRKKTGHNDIKIIQEALACYNWLVEQKENKRSIYSISTKNFEDCKKLEFEI